MELSWASMRVLPLFHHVVVLIEACIRILNYKCILQLNWCGSKQSITSLGLLCRLQIHGCFETLSCWERSILNRQERIIVKSVWRACRSSTKINNISFLRWSSWELNGSIYSRALESKKILLSALMWLANSFILWRPGIGSNLIFFL